LSLYLPANSLLASKIYGFTLSCDLYSASVMIRMNSPPIPGNFTLSPQIGIEMKDLFQFKATAWFDKDLPISYQFGFTSDKTNSILVIHERSLSNIGASSLPSGSQNMNYQLICSVQVFDSLGCSSLQYTQATVRPMSNSLSAISDVLSQISLKNSSKSQVSQTILIVSSILNNVNCSMASNCGLLNRGNCSDVPHTCGPCRLGYTGESGSHNSICVDTNAFSAISKTVNSISLTCKVDADCSSQLQTCDLKSGKCAYPSKRCTGDCSSRGNCSFVNVQTGYSVKECSLFSFDCTASCNCISGFGGVDCSLTSEQLIAKQNIRHDLLLHLSTLTVTSNQSSVSENAVQSWATSLGNNDSIIF